MTYDIEAIRSDFPILQRQVHGKPLVYLDNAATSQKPRAVIDAITDLYVRDSANIHRARHTYDEDRGPHVDPAIDVAEMSAIVLDAKRADDGLSGVLILGGGAPKNFLRERWNGFAFYGLGHRPGVKHGEQE